MHTADGAQDLKQELWQVRRRADRMEQLLVQAQREATLGHLAGRMAHEFNNILTLIIGRAEQAMASDDPELKERALEKTVACGQRAADIVGSVLGYTGSQDRTSQLIAADDLMEDALSLVAWELPKSRIQLVRHYETSEQVRVVPGRMEQVLLNLILNARRAMGSGGGTLTAVVAPGDMEGYVALKIRDTGCGIAPEDQETIFDPFFSTTEKGRAGGTGLGLSVARDLVRQAGGEVHVQSKPGVGSTFTVLLPVADGDEAH